MYISFLKKKNCQNDFWQWHCRNRREKKLLQLVCSNVIVEIGEKKFVAIVAMPLPKMERKKNSGCQNLGRN